MDWFEYINQIYSTVNVSISTNERIIVVEKEYLQNLFAILDRKSTRVVGNNDRQILLTSLMTVKYIFCYIFGNFS
jgi:hypothetical protein